MQNVRLFSPEARTHYERLRPLVLERLADITARDRQLFDLRFERFFQNLYDGLTPVYGNLEVFDDFLERLVLRMVDCHKARPDDLKALDIERDLTPDWFQRETMVGYVFYVERFADDLKGIEAHLDYIEDLEATYLHLMKVVRPREGENDGGYAVLDYRAVDPTLGSADELERLCATLRDRGISVCIDLVLNHCAKEHAWAERARAGEKTYQDYFYMFPDRRMPDEYEKTLLEVFPEFAPGNFSYYPDIDKWVWTTFNEYQWDLNWSNPEVFLEIIDIIMYWANKGVEVFRLDAVAFMWKRLGTNSQNQPEVLDLLQALRACSRITTPAVAHKAEAIVSPDDLIQYFGTGRRYGKVSNIAYHNSLMVQFWSALASRDTRLMTHTLREFPRTPASIAWGTYIRCHDDIGWAVTDEDAAAVGLNGFLHRQFLSDFYAGLFAGSHALGATFQYNPTTQDRRISGTFASLAGLEQGLASGNDQLIALSIERILLGHALICAFGGIPLIYMGDELGLINDSCYLEEPQLARDNRWLHRPKMNWEVAAARYTPGTPVNRIFTGLKKMIHTRRGLPHLNASYESLVLDIGHPKLLVHRRLHPLGTFLGIYNFSEQVQSFPTQLLTDNQIAQPFDQLERAYLNVLGSEITIGPYQRLWLT